MAARLLLLLLALLLGAARAAPVARGSALRSRSLLQCAPVDGPLVIYNRVPKTGSTSTVEVIKVRARAWRSMQEGRKEGRN